MAVVQATSKVDALLDKKMDIVQCQLTLVSHQRFVTLSQTITLC